MNSVNPSRDTGYPDTKESADAVLSELHAILASRHFCHSKRYPALLQYLVENTLAGRADLLKERTLAMEVFERPATYDMASDSVVRYTVGEVRKRLVLYYSEEGRNSTVRISLPVGSYVPEFLFGHPASEEIGEQEDTDALHISTYGAETVGFELPQPKGDVHAHPEFRSTKPSDTAASGTTRPHQITRWLGKRLPWLVAVAALVAVAFAAGMLWKRGAASSQSAVDQFWAPLLRNQRNVVICTGAVVFAQNDFSGVITAGKEADYSFVSMQNALALARVDGRVERSGATTQLVFSATEPLTGLREHSVALLGAYNNQWTLRLLQPLRFHFTPEPDESIVDRANPQVRWARDHSLPYSSADDYAILARFRDPTIDGWVVVLAGLGRNGTEAASQFAVSEHYTQLLKDKIGKNFLNRNIEVVMKVKVIDGRSGAPSILATNVW